MKAPILMSYVLEDRNGSLLYKAYQYPFIWRHNVVRSTNTDLTDFAEHKLETLAKQDFLLFWSNLFKSMKKKISKREKPFVR